MVSENPPDLQTPEAENTGFPVFRAKIRRKERKIYSPSPISNVSAKPAALHLEERGMNPSHGHPRAAQSVCLRITICAFGVGSYRIHTNEIKRLVCRSRCEIFIYYRRLESPSCSTQWRPTAKAGRDDFPAMPLNHAGQGQRATRRCRMSLRAVHQGPAAIPFSFHPSTGVMNFLKYCILSLEASGEYIWRSV